MSPSTSNESTPLLQDQSHEPQRTPLPWPQFSIILFLHFAESLATHVLRPFTPQLIRDIGVTHGDETKVGYYVGLMQSLYFLTQAMIIFHWCRISDHIGRKPVILIGLGGLSISMYCFGLSKTFWGLVLSRSLNGLLNGNISVMKSTVADMTDSTNISRAYAYKPFAWAVAGTLGPFIGGSLAYPAERFPQYFGDSRFLREYPYFLPCAVPAALVLIAWIVTLVFFKETASVDGRLASRIFRSRKSEETPSETISPLDPTPASRLSDEATEKVLPLRQLLTWPVLIASASYALLSLVDMAFRSIQPVFLSTPIVLGGLGLSPATIGNILSVFGILDGIVRVFFFARLHDRWGSKKVFTAGIASGFLVFALFPAISFFAKKQGLSTWVWFLVGLQIVASIGFNLSYGAIFIFIAAASPNRHSLGAVNGIAQVAVSAMRAIGPAAANSLFSVSISRNYLGGWLVYYVLVCIVGVAVAVAGLLPRQASGASRRAVRY